MKFGTKAATAALAGMMLLSATACSAMPSDSHSRDLQMPDERPLLQGDRDSQYLFYTPMEKDEHIKGGYTLYHRSGDQLYRYSPIADNKGNVRQNVTGLAKPDRPDKRRNDEKHPKVGKDMKEMSDDLQRDGRNMAKDAKDAAKDTVDRAKKAGRDLGKDMKDVADDVQRSGSKMMEDAKDAAKDTVDRAKEAGRNLNDDVSRTTKKAQDSIVNPSNNDLGANRAPVKENGRSMNGMS